MSDLRFNTFAAAVLATSLTAIGLDQLSASIFEHETPDKPGYLVEIATAQTDGADAGEADVAFDLMAALATADVAAGMKVTKKCVACHSFEKGGASKQGPPLWEVVSRDIASHDDFTYSAALTGLPGAWNEAALNAFLQAPKTYASGTAMNFIGLRKTKDRVNIIAYLRSLGG